MIKDGTFREDLYYRQLAQNAYSEAQKLVYNINTRALKYTFEDIMGESESLRKAKTQALHTARDGRSRRAHGAMPDCGHAEPRRGTEWWGKSALLTLALLQSEPP